MPKYCFGKKPKRSDYRTLSWKDFTTPALPSPPPSYSVLSRVLGNLKWKATTLFPMDGNDSVGNCTIAGRAHAVTVFEGLVGKRVIFPASAVDGLYFQLTGGQDTGLDELTVLNFWRKNLVGNHLLAFVSINPGNHEHVQQAIQLFGGVYLGFQVQANCIAEFDARQPWTPGTLADDGHAVFATDYTPDGGTCLTWGNTQQFTWPWWDECVDECYALLAMEAASPGFCPGFDVAKLQAALPAVTD